MSRRPRAPAPRSAARSRRGLRSKFAAARAIAQGTRVRFDPTGGVRLALAALLSCGGCFVFVEDIPESAVRDALFDAPDGDADGADSALDASDLAEDQPGDAPGDPPEDGAEAGVGDAQTGADDGGAQDTAADAIDTADTPDVADTPDLARPIPEGMVPIAAGRFMMGSSDEAGAGADERAHEVVLGYDLLVDATEVSNAQWSAVLGEAGGDPSFHTGGADLPVERVSWYEALVFANARSRAEGLEPCYGLWGCSGELGAGCAEGDAECAGYACRGVTYAGPACEGYRLPSEAEWEYLARGGAETAYPSGASDTEATGCEGLGHLDTIATYCAEGPAPVGSLAANGYGVRDTAGNLAEWVFDGYDAEYGAADAGTVAVVADPYGPLRSTARVVRGGAYDSPASDVRSAARAAMDPAQRSARVGLRLVRFDARERPTAPAGFAYVPPGAFLMGSPPAEAGRGADEALHPVTLTRPFYIDSVELDQARWGALGVPNPSLFADDARPVERVGRYEAAQVANLLSERAGLTPCYELVGCGSGLGAGCASEVRACDGFVCVRAVPIAECSGYRLPTEAEWEYAARAGASGPYVVETAGEDPVTCGGALAEVAHACQAGGETRPTGQGAPNALGLYDVHGNVAELVEDRYDPDYYGTSPSDDPLNLDDSFTTFVVRGGSFEDPPAALRLADRAQLAAKRRSALVGVRLVRNVF
jgi:sulfatase modifying factor 1